MMKSIPVAIRRLLAASLLLPAAAALPAGEPRGIPLDWSPSGLRVLDVAEASASSWLQGEGDRYAPAAAIDGDRRATKWVAPDPASEARPQWILLRLDGPREISGLALFGEKPGNDGVRDARIEVLGEGGRFSPVAAIADAPGPCWTVTFDPVRTTAARLLVTRSGGASTHTDVLEILLLGRPLGPEELEAHGKARFAAVRARRRAAREAAARAGDAGAGAEALLPGLEPLEARADALDGAEERWKDWTEAERLDAVARAEDLDRAFGRVAAVLDRLATSWPPRALEIEAARRSAADLAPFGGSADVRREKRVVAATDHVIVSLDEESSRWEATWRGPVTAALRGARFAVEVDGRPREPLGIAAEVVPIDGPLGKGLEIRQRWGGPVEVERSIAVLESWPAVRVSCRIANRSDRDAAIGSVRLLEIRRGEGWWHAGSAVESPAAVTVGGISELLCDPAGDPAGAGGERSYAGTAVLGLGHRGSGALVAGFLTGLEARPDLAARFVPGEGGVALAAEERFLGRILPPGRTLQADPVVVAAWPGLHEAMERYGDLAALSSPLPVRKGPVSLWCSWYAHRMAMTEDLVLANAAVAARHFKPLGLEIIQLDHGWQRGDITGDWIPNERFPHGLAWLAGQLEARHGLKLGLWISPTDVAATSDIFRDHPEWLLADAAGKPLVNWRWYWKPNPDCYELDASRPEAARFIEETFARLAGEGARYFKIDFIAASGGEHFRRHDPACTPGWGVLRAAMEAIRRGAGPDAWIRYCQTPPLLSAGLADGAYGGNDTLDAGLGGNIDVLRTNARSLAAGWWIDGRLYEREVCDMSVRMQASLEEARLRLALMVLAGCSISFSDEFLYLPPSRIREMQRCLPPGAPPMRPLDLLDRTIPSVWHLRCVREFETWDVVGLFDFEGQPEERTVEWASLGLDPGTEILAFELWEERFLGSFRERLTLRVPPRSSRVVVLRRPAGRPQVIATDLHLLAGWHEIEDVDWDGDRLVLSGRYRRAPGLSGRIYLLVPPGFAPRFDFPLGERSARLTNIGDGVWMQEVSFGESGRFEGSIPFIRTGP